MEDLSNHIEVPSKKGCITLWKKVRATISDPHAVESQVFVKTTVSDDNTESLRFRHESKGLELEFHGDINLGNERE